jgi:DNA helicase-2/ATP-dependent DNA helicase PcrA
MDFQKFVNGDKTYLIAPAGYGKTHTIVECLKYTTGKQLILTHTHAGIASIREKIKNSNVPNNAYDLETLSGFIQKFVLAFYVGDGLPEQDDGKVYHTFLIEKAIKIFAAPIVRQVIQATYSGLFVDEYQDCSKAQHDMIMVLANALPTHILGDPLQGIFDFNGVSVDMGEDLKSFVQFPDLETPYRWYNSGNKGLGDLLKETRTSLLQKKPIKLVTDKAVGLFVMPVADGGIIKGEKAYISNLSKIINNPKNNPDFESLLLIIPEYGETNTHGVVISKGDISHRAMIKSRIDFAGALTLLEAIDDKMFYTLARNADQLIAGMPRIHKKKKRLKTDILEKFFAPTTLNQWVKETTWVKKTKAADQLASDKIQSLFESFFSETNPIILATILLEVKKTLKIKNKRDEVFNSFRSALRSAGAENCSVYEAMKHNRNIIRRVGRKVIGKCMGTTLLTKGLEFDTVVIIDAHKFACPKHLYVALTRCCKNLIIFTANDILSPYSKN